MSSTENRKKLHTYIADPDEKKVLAMLILLKDEVPYQTKTSFTEKEKKEIRKREKDHVSGKSKIYPLEEAKKMFRTKKQ